MKHAFVEARQFIYSYVASQPCLRCGRSGVEVAHLKGFPSYLYEGNLPSRRGINQMCVIPLCPDCHRLAPDSIHNVGERNFSATMNKPEDWIFRVQSRILAEAFEQLFIQLPDN